VSQSVIEKALEAQEALLIRVKHSSPASDAEIAEHGLLLTHLDAQPPEISRAFAFWVTDLGSAVLNPGRKVQRLCLRAKHGSNPKKPEFERDSDGKRRESQDHLEWWESIRGYRLGLRGRVLEMLGETTDERTANIERARTKLKEESDAGALLRILIVTRMWWDGAEFRTDPFYMCPSEEGWFMLALIKIFGFAPMLRACRLESCGRVFISRPPLGGGPRLKYCVPDHREIATQLTGAERTAKWRSRQARKGK
jgi:hypothetical protein